MKLFSMDMQYARDKKDIISIMVDYWVVVSNLCDAVRTFVARISTAFRGEALRPAWSARGRPSATFRGMNNASAEAILAAVAAWARTRDDVRALALIGSWARGNARLASDIDLLALSDCAAGYRRSYKWMSEIDFARIGHSIKSTNDATYGAVWSRHVHLHPAGEIELTFALCAWASTAPIEPGTRAIVNDGFRITLDKDGSLARLVRAVAASKQTQPSS
jgi:uncharacterized protein